MPAFEVAGTETPLLEAEAPGLVYLGLGSNLGRRREYLRSVVNQLQQLDGLSLKAISSLYETEPVGYTDQPLFLNAVVAGSYNGDPVELLRRCLAIEGQLGRERRKRWGPRTVDIDLLLFGRRIIYSPELTVPHPRISQRAFVLCPLLELAPSLTDPRDGHPFRRDLEHLDRLQAEPGVNNLPDGDSGAATESQGQTVRVFESGSDWARGPSA